MNPQISYTILTPVTDNEGNLTGDTILTKTTVEQVKFSVLLQKEVMSQAKITAKDAEIVKDNNEKNALVAENASDQALINDIINSYNP